MEKKTEMSIRNIPLDRLQKSNTKRITNILLTPLQVSMEAIGMIEPLLVCEEGENFLIVDGNKRYLILLAAGIETVPCIVVPCLDTYTASRQVIDVSPTERVKMIKKALETVAEEKVAAAIGVSSLKPVLDDKFAVGLSKLARLAYENKKLTKTALQKLKHVTPKRQDEILKEITQKGYKQTNPTQGKPCSLDIIKGMVLLTPDKERVVQERKAPWKIRDEKAESITKELREVEERADLMAGKYHAYVSDVMKLLTYMRRILNDEKIKQYVRTNYPDLYKVIREIMDREK